MSRRLLILTEGCHDPITAKTAVNVIRYKREDVVAVLDSTRAGRSAGEVLGVGGELPIVGSVHDAAGANTLLIGVATPGGKLPGLMRQHVLEAIALGMNVESGLHEFLSDDPEFVALAAKSGSQLKDVRKNSERDVAHRKNIREECLRIHTVGSDCSVGKMVVSVELALAMKRRGLDAKFVATGQTGILIEGDGIPIDCVVADFINGAAEKLVLANQQHEIIVVEGQGSLMHPRYSSVTLGLLHGCVPDGLIVCYEVGRTKTHNMEWIEIPPLKEVVRINEEMARIMHPCKVIGFGLNTRKCTAEEAAEERKRIEGEFGLPACDVLRDGSEPLVEAVLKLKKELGKSQPVNSAVIR